MKLRTIYQYAFAAAVAALFVTSTPVRASEADGKIESSFEETYVYMTYLKDDAVKIDAKDGVVTLTGTVAEESHKGLAEETAASLPGVDRVDNQLASEAEAAADHSDKWIGRKVNLALMFHRNVNAGNTDVEVEDGIVTITGEADSAAQKELTAEYAKDIKGVKEVKNEMTVAATPETAEQIAENAIVDDASITAQVRTALRTHHSTSAMNTTVGTVDGEVTLTGIANNAAEKSLVTKLVGDIQGVTSVNNQMTIKKVT